MTSIEAYIGGSGAKFPILHYDGLHTHAFLMQLYGVKEYVVFPPDQSRYFYPRAETANVTSILDIENVDLARFPLFAQARGLGSSCIRERRCSYRRAGGTRPAYSRLRSRSRSTAPTPRTGRTSGVITARK